MAVFIWMYILLGVIFLMSTEVHNVKKKRLFQSISCFLLLWLIQGLRHETIGVDSYNAYRPFYENLSGTLNSLYDFREEFYNYETGFVTYSKLLKFIGLDTQMFILISSFLSIGPIAYFIYKHSPNIILSFCIFASFNIYHFGFSGIRQAIAIGLTTLACEMAFLKKNILFVVIVVLASTFHFSAIIFLIVYPLCNKLNISLGKMIGISTLFIVSLFSLKSLTAPLVELIFGGDRYTGVLSNTGALSYNLLILLYAFLLFTYVSKSESVIKYRPILLIAVAFQSLGLLSTYASRLAYYYSFFLAITLPLTCQTFRFRMRLFVNFVIVVFMIYFYFYVNSDGYLDVIPYKFFWK